MKFFLLKMTMSMGLLTLAAAEVHAQNTRNCAPRDIVVQRLADKYGETRQSIGLGSNNAVVEIFASDESGTWSIAVTMPSGMTCLVASGQAYEQLAETLPPKGNDA